MVQASHSLTSLSWSGRLPELGVFGTQPGDNSGVFTEQVEVACGTPRPWPPQMLLLLSWGTVPGQLELPEDQGSGAGEGPSSLHTLSRGRTGLINRLQQLGSGRPTSRARYPQAIGQMLQHQT